MAQVTDLIGKTLSHIKADTAEITFTTTDDLKYLMYHERDCCECVTIEEIAGDLSNLVGEPIVIAEEAVSDGEPMDFGSSTWTFYKLATIKGYVDIRWYGESNGYYCESVNFILLKN